MNKNKVILSILAAVGVGIPLGTAISNAAREDNISAELVAEYSRDATIDAIVTMRSLGLSKSQIEDETAANIGVQKREIQHLVNAAINRPQERANRSRHNITMILLIDANDSRTFRLYAQGFCEPLKKDVETDLYRRCMQNNDMVQGVQICKGGVHVLHKIQLQVTEPQFERISRSVGTRATILTGDDKAHLAASGLSVCLFE
jgi:hypothetical protein